MFEFAGNDVRCAKQVSFVRMSGFNWTFNVESLILAKRNRLQKLSRRAMSSGFCAKVRSKMAKFYAIKKSLLSSLK